MKKGLKIFGQFFKTTFCNKAVPQKPSYVPSPIILLDLSANQTISEYSDAFSVSLLHKFITQMQYFLLIFHCQKRSSVTRTNENSVNESAAPFSWKHKNHSLRGESHRFHFPFGCHFPGLVSRRVTLFRRRACKKSQRENVAVE